METQTQDIAAKSNVLKLPVSFLPPRASSPPTKESVVYMAEWTFQERVKSISAAIRDKFGGDVFLTSEQAAQVLHISTRTLSRIPRASLQRFPGEGSAGTLYATCDIAHYFVKRASENNDKDGCRHSFA